MKIKPGLTVSTEDPWYDLTDGGYLKPKEICENLEDAERVLNAIKTIQEFFYSCDEQIDNFYR